MLYTDEYATVNYSSCFHQFLYKHPRAMTAIFRHAPPLLHTVNQLATAWRKDSRALPKFQSSSQYRVTLKNYHLHMTYTMRSIFYSRLALPSNRVSRQAAARNNDKGALKLYVSIADVCLGRVVVSYWITIPG